MRSGQRVGGGSLTLRLAMIGVVPLAAISVLAFDRIRDANLTVEQAGYVAEMVELERDVAEVLPLANVEQIALSGLAAIDEIGVQRSIVTQFTGLDAGAIYESNRVLLDERLDRLRDEHGDVVLQDGSTLDATLDQLCDQLDVLRAYNDARDPRPDEINRFFERLDTVLAEARRTSADRTLTRSPDIAALHQLGNVLTSGGERSQVIVAGVLRAENYDAPRLAEINAIHNTHRQSLVDALAPEPAAHFATVRMVEMPQAAAFELDPATRSVTAADSAGVFALAGVFVEEIAYLQGLEEFSAAFHAKVLREARAETALAESTAQRAKWLVAAIFLLAAAATLFALLGIGRPVTRLADRAHVIGAGDLTPDPITPRGPRVIRRLTASMNDMVHTLHGVDRQIEQMSRGDFETADQVDLPGPIGVALRHSVNRLTEVTTQLRRSEELASAIVAQAADAIWTIDDMGVISFANESSTLLTGLEPTDQVGHRLDDFISTSGDDVRIRSTDGSRRSVLLTRSPVNAGSDMQWTVVAHDISERAEFEVELARQARFDVLTELPNRFAALEHLDALGEDGIEFTVLFVDIDGFKSVNDTHGHAVGDSVLTEIAGRISRSVRPNGFAARLGGDEFVVVIVGSANMDDAVALGERIIRHVEMPYDLESGTFLLSASVGAVQSTVATDALDALRKADSALYVAKNRGRGRVERFNAALQVELHREAALALALRQGIRNDELVIHLQPIMNLATNSMDCAEALVRWDRPGLGLVSPHEFIPIAERSSLVIELGQWVLQNVCARLADWRQRDPAVAVRVGVNISSRHLIEGDLIADLDIALGSTGADAHMLEIELTESHLLEDTDKAVEVLSTVRARGIRVSVDDFGTGYSSMNYLRTLPVDALKIDQSFVARSTDGGYDSTVIEAVLTIAHSLGLDVTAEGIETEQQLNFVRDRGCQRAQGYLLARPVPLGDAEQLLLGERAGGVGAVAHAMDL